MKKTFLLKTMLLLCALVVGGSAWASNNISTVSTSFSTTGNVTSCFTQTGDLTAAAWNLAVTWKDNASWQNLNADKGSQIGSGSHPATGIVLTGSSIPGTITSVVVNTSGAKDINANVAVTVGGTVFKCNNNETASLTSSAANYTFTGSASGNVVITWTNSSDKAIYIKSITTTYTTSSSEPSITLGSNTINATAAAVSTTSINVTYNNLTNYSSEVKFYESDGTTPATYSWMTASINSTTKNLDYSITANTGAARTAYLKVHAVSNDADVESGLITITQAAYVVDDPTFNLEHNGYYLEGTGITITSEGNTIYYTYTTNGNDPATPNATNGTVYTTPIALNSGTLKIWAIAYRNGVWSSVVKRTYNGVAPATLPFSWTGTSSAGKADLAAKTGVVLSLGTDYATSNAPYRLKFDGVGKHVTIFTDEKPEAVYFTAKLFNATSTGSKIKVQGSTDGLTFTDVQEFTINGSADDTFEFTTSNAFAATHRAVKLIMSSKDVNVAVGTICVSCLPVKITNAEYATFSNAHVLDFSNTGIKVFTAKDNETSVTLSEVTTGKVPANTPVVLYKAGGATINVPVIASAPAISGTNDLHVSDGTTALSNVYVLAKPEGEEVGFYPWDGSTLSAGKIYLQGSASYTRDFIGIGDASGISNVKVNTNLDGNYYDLQGRQVAQPTKGLYIVNGKKVVIK